MASFKAKLPVLQELFAKNHRGGALWAPPSGARVNFEPQRLTAERTIGMASCMWQGIPALGPTSNLFSPAVISSESLPSSAPSPALPNPSPALLSPESGPPQSRVRPSSAPSPALLSPESCPPQPRVGPSSAPSPALSGHCLLRSV